MTITNTGVDAPDINIDGAAAGYQPGCFAELVLSIKPLSMLGTATPLTDASYHGYYFGGLTSIALNMRAPGSFSGNDGLGCQISGQLKPIDNRSLYQLAAAVTGPPACGGGIYGVAFQQNTDPTGQFSNSPGTYLVLIGSNDLDAGFAAVLKQ